MDGANAFQRFFNITVPSLRVVTGIVVSLGLLNGFKVFDIIYVMTGGGPNHASEVFGTYLYNLAFGSTSGSLPQFGYASAFSVVVMMHVHPRRRRPDDHHPEGGAVTATLQAPTTSGADRAGDQRTADRHAGAGCPSARRSPPSSCCRSAR